ncbi:Por secretion system C-terminal sorting domain-containing protein [Flavobacterium fontis]|uniref:Por secretion system C-terminal sorting domain-containing protein n=1 Tax=Flavobacterium fontis TaxID=1124188 RepID=A0A1M4XD50_9FLAO|nr:GEVED domain-containing protein [Flavobacterium fontis]SHE91333.1 Por secretion system C-terminal sorting domain-containing protein [Flavobacterium fontis]
MEKFTSSFNRFFNQFKVLHWFASFLFLFVFNVESFGQTTILNETFGAGTALPTGWTSSNTTNGWTFSSASASTGYAGASGTGNIVFNSTGTNGATHTLTYANNLSTVGLTNITVLWAGRGTASFTGAVPFQWSTDGTTWNNVTYTQVAYNASWALVNGGTRITLPSGAAGVTNLRFRWTGTASNNGNFRIDDFTVQGTSNAITSAQSGDWAATSTWVGGVVPTATDNVIIAAGHTVSTAASLTRTGSTTVNGTFQLNSGGFASGTNFTYGSSGGLNFNSSGAYGVDASHVYWPTTSGPVNVSVLQGGLTLNAGANRTVSGTFQTAAGVTFGSATLTFNGICRINTGGFFNNTPSYGSTSTLIYNTGTSFGRGNEWTTATSGAGYPANVQISNPGTVTTVNMGSNFAQCSGTLTIDASTIMNTPSGGLIVLGNVVNNGTISLGGDVTTPGNWTLGASATQTNNNRAVFFNGATGTQTIARTGGGNVFFDYLIINKAAGSVQLSASPATSITINTTAGEVLQLLNAGAFDLNGQSLTLNNTNGNILVNAAGRSITSTLTGAVINITGNKFVTGAGTLNLGSNITMILTSGMDFGPSRTTLNGTLQINGGGFVSTNAPIYSSVSTLVYNGVTSYGVNSEWTGNAATAGVGTPQNVTLTNSSVNMPASSARALAGNLSISSGSILNLGTSPGGDLNIGGNFTNNGTFNANTRLVVFNGTVAQTLTGATTFDLLRLNNSAGLTLNNAIVVITNLDLTAGRITLGSNNLSLGSTASISNASATNYVVTNGTGRLVKAAVGNTAFTFPIGLNATNYTPVAVTNTVGTSDLSVNVGSTITNAVFDATRIVNLQWSINSSAATTATVTPTWVAANQAASFTNTGIGELGIFTTAYTTSPVTLNTNTTTAAGLAFQNGSNLIVVGNSNAIVCSTFIAPTITGQPVNTTLIAATTNNTASFSTSATGASAFQWQYSTTPGGTYTNVANNTPNGLSYTGNTTATLNITSNSNTAGGVYYYRCVVTGTCGATSTTNVGALTVYCGSRSVDSTFEHISNVTVAGGINQSSGASNYTSYFATQTATVSQGQLLTVTVTGGGTIVADDAAYVLADWNQDGDFSDSGETSSPVTGLGPVYNVTITVPATATLGKTRMRIKYGDTVSGTTAMNATPCQVFTYGEVEDYGLLVTVASSPTITSLSATSGCVGGSITINGTDLNGVVASNVTIGGTPVASITSNSATQIVAVIGSGTTGVVQVTTAGGTATSLDTFTVNPVASATWSGTATAVCASGAAQTTTLAYSATSGAASTYSITWNATPTNSFAPVTNEPNTFNTGAGTITIQIPAGTAAGTYTGTITVSNAFGCPSASTVFTLTVNPTPTATASNGGPYCEGGTIALTAGPSGMSSYAWTGPNGFSSNSTQQTVTQNFNGLGTGTTWTDNVTLPGWYLLQGQGTGTTSSPATPVTTLVAGTGSGTAVGVYNLSNGVTTTDRALGSLAGNSIASAGSTAYYYGVRVTNTTGFPVSNVTISYTGEQYRDTNTVPQTLTVDYSTNATALTTASGTWTSIPALTYTSTTNANSLQIDGNAAANRNANLTTTLTGLSIPNGESIWIRWADLNDSGNDHLLAIDDVTVVLTANANPMIANATPAMSGVYTLTVTNAFGCTSTATTTVTVDAAPVAGTVSSDQTICSGDVPTDLTLSGFSGTIQKWQRADDLAFTTNVTDITNTTATLSLGALTATGYYRAVVSNGSCVAVNSNVVTITVSPTTVAGTLSSNQTVCTGTGATLTLNGQTGSVVKWQRADDLAFTVNVTDISNTTATLNTGSLSQISYYRAVVKSGACLEVTTNVVTITVTPNTTITAQPQSQTVCQGGSVTFSVTAANSPSGYLYQWYKNGVSISGETNATLTIAAVALTDAATYTVEVLGECGPVLTSDNAVLTVNSPTTPTFNAVNPICIGDSLSALPTTSNNGIVGTWTPALDNTQTTTYTFTPNAGQCATTASLTITVNSLVTPTFSPVAPICQGAPLAALPTTSTNGITGAWSPALDNTQTTTYTFTPDAGQCASTTTLTITVGGTTTWNGTAWSNGVPDALTTAVIAGNYTATANLDACSLVVNNNAVVVIPAGFNVHLSGALTVASGSTFTLNSNANLLQDDASAVNSGNIIVRRTTNPLIRLDYVMWSSPVAAQNLQAFSPLTSVSPTIRFYTYNTTTNLFANVADFATHPMVLGRGYLIRLPFNHPTAPATWTGIFTGVPNNGTQNITMANVAPGQRYNLVGNPYPSTLSMTDFYNDNSNAIEPTVYFWRKTNGTQNPTYCTYNLSTDTYTDNGQPFTEDPNGVIQVGQGFIVEAKDAATTLTFNNGQRVANNANQTFRTAASTQSIERHRVWLNLTGTAGEFSQMMVGYFTDGTLGLDGTDSKYFNDGTTELTSPVNGVACVMNGRPVPFDAADVVPLTYKVATAGTFSVAIDRKDGLFASTTQPIYVHDLTTGTYHNLNDGPYTFTTAVGTFANRLELVYQNALSTENPTLNANTFTVVKNPTQVQVTATESIDTVRVYDLRGRLIVQQSKVNATQVSLPVVGNQVYLVQVTTTSGLTGVKKVL